METEVKKNHIGLKLVVNFCRVILGAVFMFSGIAKAIDPVGTQIKLADYMYAFGMGGTFLDSTLLIFACLLAGFEILFGIYMLTGSFGKGTSWIVLVIMVLLTPFTLYLALKNPVEDCGCFGDALVLTNWQTFYKNLFLLVLALVVFIWRSKIVPFISPPRQWIVTLVMVCIIVRFMTGNIRNLPVIDFRPYKIGTDLRAEVLERSNPAMTDFFITDDSLADQTANILGNKGYSFLLVSPHLESASENNLDLIDDVYDYCEHWGYDMIGLTASGADAIRKWTEDTGAEYRFLNCDEIPLQTMVRSNPGLMLLKDGVIINKWSHSGIPSDEELSAPLDEISLGTIPADVPWRTPWAILLLFLSPLVLIVLIDLFKRLIQ